jgi:hypothetical protein
MKKLLAFECMRRDDVSTHIVDNIHVNRKHLNVLDNLTTHSLMHTGQTLLSSIRHPVEVHDRITNHNPNEKTDMSARNDSHKYDEPAREWLQIIADQFDALSVSNVVQLGEA